MGFEVTGEITGLADVLARLSRLRQGARNKIVRPGVDKMTRIIARRVKELAPVQLTVLANKRGYVFSARKYTKRRLSKDSKVVETTIKGALRKAVASKVMAGRGGVVVGKVGVRKGFKVVGGVRTRGKNKGQTWYHDPARIAHLVELGHGGPHPAPAYSFMRRGFDEKRSEAAAAGIAVMQEKIAQTAAGK